jgi:hypothetical protein
MMTDVSAGDTIRRGIAFLERCSRDGGLDRTLSFPNTSLQRFEERITGSETGADGVKGRSRKGFDDVLAAFVARGVDAESGSKS